LLCDMTRLLLHGSNHGRTRTSRNTNSLPIGHHCRSALAGSATMTPTNSRSMGGDVHGFALREPAMPPAGGRGRTRRLFGSCPLVSPESDCIAFWIASHDLMRGLNRPERQRVHVERSIEARASNASSPIPRWRRVASIPKS
jgi:hypothetical protein